MNKEDIEEYLSKLEYEVVYEIKQAFEAYESGKYGNINNSIDAVKQIDAGKSHAEQEELRHSGKTQEQRGAERVLSMYFNDEKLAARDEHIRIPEILREEKLSNIERAQSVIAAIIAEIPQSAEKNAPENRNAIFEAVKAIKEAAMVRDNREMYAYFNMDNEKSTEQKFYELKDDFIRGMVDNGFQEPNIHDRFMIFRNNSLEESVSIPVTREYLTLMERCKEEWDRSKANYVETDERRDRIIIDFESFLNESIKTTEIQNALDKANDVNEQGLALAGTEPAG